MKHFMVCIDLPPIVTEDFLTLVPKQRAHVSALINGGRILSYTLTGDRSKIWVVFVAAAEEEVIEMVESFPLSKFMEASIHELAFHHHTNMGLMHFSSN